MLRESGGSLVTIAGNGARMPSADFTIGSSVNASCLAFSKALADLGKRDGIQVNAINPGTVETERFWRRLRQLMERTGRDETTQRQEYQRDLGVTRFGLPQDIAGLVAFIASPRGRWLHGATIDMDGGEVRGF
jgi:3-oxoacyl-[acyl-carrier protein] reductase